MHVIIAACLAVVLTTAAFAQGPLAPTNAPAPVFKTLHQVEPRQIITGATFTITRPGSYYLVTNILYTGSGNGIVIATNDVTIDLNGFTLAGNASSGSGIYRSGFPKNIVIHNGIIRNWGSSGISLSGGDNCHLHDLVVLSNDYRGAELGYNSRVERCLISENGDMGLHSFGPSFLADSASCDNGDAGFYLVSRAVIHRCLASANSEHGFEASDGSVLADCAATLNTSNGFNVTAGVKLTGCTASENYQSGFFLEEGCHVERCSAYMNRLHGINASNDNYVIDNHCSTNGPFGTGAGIYVQGRGNRVDGNSVNRNDYGLWVVGASNLVIRNSAQGNTVSNFVIVASNSVGGVANVAAVSFTNTNPWTNFEF